VVEGEVGWLLTTEFDPCLTHLSLPPVFLQTNLTPETTFTALALVQFSAKEGVAGRTPKIKVSAKRRPAERLLPDRRFAESRLLFRETMSSTIFIAVPYATLTIFTLESPTSIA
jgi:hypothetical protein